MGIQDRDWYREAQLEREKRESRSGRGRMFGGRESPFSDVEDARIVSDPEPGQTVYGGSTVLKMVVVWLLVLFVLYSIADYFWMPDERPHAALVVLAAVESHSA